MLNASCAVLLFRGGWPLIQRPVFAIAAMNRCLGIGRAFVALLGAAIGNLLLAFTISGIRQVLFFGIWREKLSDKNLSDRLTDFTMSLIGDLEDLRARRISVAEARVRAQMAREVLRSAHLQLQGLKLFSDQAKQITSD